MHCEVCEALVFEQCPMCGIRIDAGDAVVAREDGIRMHLRDATSESEVAAIARWNDASPAPGTPDLSVLIPVARSASPHWATA